MKRIAIYSYYDKNSKMEEYAAFYIRSLLDVADDIYVVINGKIADSELEKIKNNRITIIQKENSVCDDIGAYKQGLFSIDKEVLEKIDEVIFANSSCFGPFYSFVECFNKMKESKVDFWGISKCSIQNKNIMNFKSPPKSKEYIQTYFFVVRKKILQDSKFFEYFESLEKIKNKKETTHYFETNLTDYLKQLGYTYSTLIDDSILKYGVANYSYSLPDICIQEYKSPLINKTLFGDRCSCYNNISGGMESKSAFNYIKNNTNYDTDMILNYIAKNYSMNEIKKYLHLNFILSDTKREHFSLNKNVLFLENHEDFMEILEPHLEEISSIFDIYAIPKKEIEYKKLRVKNLNSSESYFKQIKSIISNYRHVLMFSLDYKMLNSLNPFHRRNYIKHLLNCCIVNKIYAANAVNTLIQNPKIGMLTPIPFIDENFKIAKPAISNKLIKEFARKYNCEIKIDPNFLKAIPSVFWADSSALCAIEDVFDFEYDYGINRSMIFSILMQKYGYFTGTISNTESMINYADNLEYSSINRNRFFAEIALGVKKIKNAAKSIVEV